jgi:hypothetical protein
MQQTGLSQNQPPQHKTVKLLIFNPSPRFIKVFETKIKFLNSKYDIYRVRFDWDEQHAYEEGRQFFLSHPEYTHMAILPDDLLVETHHVDKLVSDLEENPNIDVISGVCNFSCVNKKFFNTLAVIPADKTGAYSMFKTLAKYQYDSLTIREHYNEQPKGLRKVLFAAFSLTIASRSVLQKFGFRPIEPRGTIAAGMGLDTLFYNNCLRSNIQCWADYDVMLLHIKDIERNNDVTFLIRFAHENSISTGLVKASRFKQENVLLKAGSIIS